MPFDRYDLTDRNALDETQCVPAESVTLRFTQGQRYVHVLQDGILSAQLERCAGGAACTFAWEPQACAVLTILVVTTAVLAIVAVGGYRLLNQSYYYYSWQPKLGDGWVALRSRLTGCAVQAATLCSPGCCNPMCSTLQPYAIQTAIQCS